MLSITFLKIYRIFSILIRIIGKIKNFLFPKIILQTDTSNNYQNENIDSIFKDKSLKNIFEYIYFNNNWRSGKNNLFDSGDGSHNEKFTVPYIQAVNKFLSEVSNPVTIVDLGCGDFNIGKQIKGNIKKYIACDIVGLLIRYNKNKFKNLNVDFKVINIVDEPLPDGDVAMIRQVLQHLSNKNIKSIAAKLKKYKYIIVTEHLPDDKFIPNIDKTDDGNIRIFLNSGVELTEAPYFLKPLKESVLCIVKVEDNNDLAGMLKTTLYEMF